MLLVTPQNTIEQRKVRLGIQGKSRVEVLTGLTEGDRVVIGNRSQYREGEKVQPKEVAPVNSQWRRRELMSGFSIRNPFFIMVCCLIVAIVGTVTLVRMPVDLFPPINIPVVVVATFYSGMPPQQIETSITNPFERFFTLASGVDHIESRSLPGVSLIKIYFQAGSNADADLSTISNLAMADLRRLPPGTLPPVVLKFDASSLPVCLITLKGEGLNETELHDLGQYNVRNQIANVPGSSVPQPFGGRYRQIMVYVDPLKLQAHQLSPMDVVRQLNESNLILPAGDVKIGPFDYNLYSNSQAPTAKSINTMPLKTVGQSSVLVGDIGKAVDAEAIQTNIVRVDGQPSVYLPILKQGGDTNTIAVVEGIKDALKHLVDIPKQLKTRVVFDQSIFVRTAIDNLIHEGGIGLLLTGLMILLFLGSVRATAAVFLSIPLSALAAFLAIGAGGGTVNTMVLGGLALAFSRLIDNSVIVLENIFRHLEMGESPEVAAEKGGSEVALAVLAATIATSIVFFPVVFLVWRQPVFVCGAGDCGDFVAVRVLHGGDDGGAAVLRETGQESIRRTKQSVKDRSKRGSAKSPKDSMRYFATHAGKVRPDAGHGTAEARGYRDRAGRSVVAVLRVVSASGCFVFPAHRSRAIRDQPESADRFARGIDRRLREEVGRHHPRCGSEK